LLRYKILFHWFILVLLFIAKKKKKEKETKNIHYVIRYNRTKIKEKKLYKFDEN